MIDYAAFLRGINVGGFNIKMDQLRATFAELGFENVKTVLASGNVLFRAVATNEDVLTAEIEQKLLATFGREIDVLVRKVDELQRLAGTGPFAGVTVTPDTRLYVTFLSGESRSNLKIPYESPDRSFRIIHASKREVCAVLTLSPNSRTVDLMSFLEKEYGRQITTRNWNTIAKMLKAG